VSRGVRRGADICACGLHLAAGKDKAGPPANPQPPPAQEYGTRAAGAGQARLGRYSAGPGLCGCIAMSFRYLQCGRPAC